MPSENRCVSDGIFFFIKLNNRLLNFYANFMTNRSLYRKLI